MIGRHPTDAAFLLEAPFHDDESDLDVKYAVGTFPGGTDVLNWEVMEGPMLVRSSQIAKRESYGTFRGIITCLINDLINFQE